LNINRVYQWHIFGQPFRMLKNYLRVAFRSLSRNKIFTFVNIFGLSTGLATCLLILIYIDSETGYDRQNKDASLIYRVITSASTASGDHGRAWAATAPPIAWGLKTDLPEVAISARLLKFPQLDKFLLTSKDGREKKQFYEPNGYYVDSTFLRLFTYDFLYGNSQAALDVPNTMVISEELAEKLYGPENPVGRLITIGLPFGNFDYTIKGVFRDKDRKTHIPAHFFLSMRNNDVGQWVDGQTNWATNNIFHTYIRLKSGVDVPAFQRKLNADIDRRSGPDLKAFGITRQLLLQPLASIYLHSNLDDEIAPVGNATTLNILGIIAAFILLIACINFMNLSTARSANRAKEVGVRKVLGAEKRSLVFQFLCESILLSALGLLLALGLARLLLPVFDSLVQKPLQLNLPPVLWLGIAGLTLLTGIIAGLYPAFYLSAFRPVAVLKGRLLNNFSALAIRKGLIVFQFTISICLITGAIIIVRQLNYLNSQPLGFRKNQQIVLQLQSQDAVGHFVTLRDELNKIPAISSVTGGSSYPGLASVNDLLFYGEGKTVNDVIDINLLATEDDYLKTLGLILLHGRDFTRASTADSNSLIMNETALKQLGYDPRSAVGRHVYYDFHGQHATMEIVGVVKDFNFESLYSPIKPLAFTTTIGNKHGFLLASLNTTDYASVLGEVGRAWNKINPGLPFVYSFLDKDFQSNYEKDQRTSGIVGVFTIVAILIACLGLFGLSVFSAEQRTREIGIRKVLGASVSNITLLLSRDFLGLVLIALLISCPLGWYAMHQWLQGFAYRTTISWWLFPLAGCIALLVAWLTVSFQAIGAALANPVRSLRSE
jgi:putative ABC transport system permease protein